MPRKPAIDSNSVHAVMDTLESVREYPSGCYAREAKAVKLMLGQGYTQVDIIGCYLHLKEDHFWKEKSLTMTSVAKEIGEWRKHRDTPKLSYVEQQHLKHVASFEQKKEMERAGMFRGWIDRHHEELERQAAEET